MGVLQQCMGGGETFSPQGCKSLGSPSLQDVYLETRELILVPGAPEGNLGAQLVFVLIISWSKNQKKTHMSLNDEMNF